MTKVTLSGFETVLQTTAASLHFFHYGPAEIDGVGGGTLSVARSFKRP